MPLNIARHIDHTLLKPDATRSDIEKLCHEAQKHGFYAVCIQPFWIATAKELLSNSDVKVCTVIGFPLGGATTKVKIHEAVDALALGADELDVVMNIGTALDHNWEYVDHEIRKIIEVAKGKCIKIIVETGLLSDVELRVACEVIENAGAQFIKTSTGFSKEGATIKAVKAIRSVVAQETGIKAAGGIRTLHDALEMIKAGATRIGTSSGIDIVKAAESQQDQN